MHSRIKTMSAAESFIISQAADCQSFACWGDVALINKLGDVCRLHLAIGMKMNVHGWKGFFM